MARTHVESETLLSLARKAGYRAGELATLAGMNQRQLHRTFKRMFGKSPREWLSEKKMQDVALLLRSGAPVKHAAAEACFGESSSFCRWFKTQSGMTPGGSQHRI